MARQPSSGGNLCLYFLAIFVSPIPVLLISGCGADFLINIALYILGWIPGVIHAWWLISRSERHVGGPVHRHPAQQPIYAPSQPVQPGYGQQQMPVTGARYGGVSSGKY